jgi:hypothetical protein
MSDSIADDPGSDSWGIDGWPVLAHGSVPTDKELEAINNTKLGKAWGSGFKKSDWYPMSYWRKLHDKQPPKPLLLPTENDLQTWRHQKYVCVPFKGMHGVNCDDLYWVAENIENGMAFRLLGMPRKGQIYFHSDWGLENNAAHVMSRERSKAPFQGRIIPLDSIKAVHYGIYDGSLKLNKEKMEYAFQTSKPLAKQGIFCTPDSMMAPYWKDCYKKMISEYAKVGRESKTGTELFQIKQQDKIPPIPELSECKSLLEIAARQCLLNETANRKTLLDGDDTPSQTTYMPGLGVVSPEPVNATAEQRTVFKVDEVIGEQRASILKDHADYFLQQVEGCKIRKAMLMLPFMEPVNVNSRQSLVDDGSYTRFRYVLPFMHQDGDGKFYETGLDMEVTPTEFFREVFCMRSSRQQTELRQEKLRSYN